MTGKSITKFYQMSDDALIREIGLFVSHHRLLQNIKQKDLAEKAGINRTTLSDLELGKRCQLLTLIQVLRILKQLHVSNGEMLFKQNIEFKNTSINEPYTIKIEPNQIFPSGILIHKFTMGDGSIYTQITNKN